jgi:hypothetical protein
MPELAQALVGEKPDAIIFNSKGASSSPRSDKHDPDCRRANGCRPSGS